MGGETFGGLDVIRSFERMVPEIGFKQEGNIYQNTQPELCIADSQEENTAGEIAAVIEYDFDKKTVTIDRTHEKK